MIDPLIISTEINSLETLADKIEKDMKKLLPEAHVIGSEAATNIYLLRFLDFIGDSWDLQRETMKNYEKWYAMSLLFVQQYVPEKQNEFTSYYSVTRNDELSIKELLQFKRRKEDYIRGSDLQETVASFKGEVLRDFIGKFDRQRHILLTIPGIVKIKELSIRGIIFTTFIDREIDEAVYLFEKGHPRAAGAIAGVALEQHLRFLCDKYDLDYGKKDTIEPLVQKLYKNEKIDRTQLTQIQHLASIRDKCDHPSEISASEVKELIERVKKILNN